jgi:hypothetical protein
MSTRLADEADRAYEFGRRVFTKKPPTGVSKSGHRAALNTKSPPEGFRRADSLTLNFVRYITHSNVQMSMGKSHQDALPEIAATRSPLPPVSGQRRTVASTASRQCSRAVGTIGFVGRATAKERSRAGFRRGVDYLPTQSLGARPQS